MSRHFNSEDAIQVCVGAFALAVPISFSEEAWTLGATLPTINVVLLLILSLVFLAGFAYQSIFQANIRTRIRIYLFRIVIAYFIAAIIVALVLLSLDKLPLISDTVVAVKRIIVITMPASMGAIVVDSFDKE